MTEQLQAASDDAIIARVLSLRNAGLRWPQGIDEKTAARVYGFALKGLPLAALKSAVTKIIQGEFADIRDFMPTPPALAALVRAEARPLIDRRANLKLTQEAMERVSSGEASEMPDEAAKARVRAMVAGVRASAEAFKRQNSPNYKPDASISAEQADYYRQILALNDAPNVSADHMAARRFASKRIETADPPHVEPVQGAYFLALQQQEEMENGKSNEAQSGAEDQDRSGDADRPEGHEERDSGD